MCSANVDLGSGQQSLDVGVKVASPHRLSWELGFPIGAYYQAGEVLGTSKDGRQNTKQAGRDVGWHWVLNSMVDAHYSVHECKL